MDWSWITTTWEAAWMAVVSTVGIFIALILYTRIAGLRSFSKMSSFDFAMTVAIGSLVASTVLNPDPPLLRSAVALAAIYGVQFLTAHLRVRLPWVQRLVDNEPLLLAENGHLLESNMRLADISRQDVLAKLREANVLRMSQARAVVLETTGDISVLHAEADSPEVEDVLLEGVRRE